jgi:hypothetical protein
MAPPQTHPSICVGVVVAAHADAEAGLTAAACRRAVARAAGDGERLSC